MVSTAALLAMFFTLLLTLFGPIALLIFYALRHKKQGIWSAWAFGALGFFIPQVIIRLPILSILGLFPQFTTFATENYLIYILILALTAALFELAGRYIVAKLMSKNLTLHRSIAVGLGHGGIEAIVLVGLTYVNNIIYSILINTGIWDSIIDSIAMTGNIAPYIQISNSLIGTPAYLYLLAGYERILTIICHLAMSLIVCYFVVKKQDIKGLLICLCLHTLLDFSSAFILYCFPATGQGFELGYALVYGFLTLMAVVSIFIIKNLIKKFKQIQ